MGHCWPQIAPHSWKSTSSLPTRRRAVQIGHEHRDARSILGQPHFKARLPLGMDLCLMKSKPNSFVRHAAHPGTRLSDLPKEAIDLEWLYCELLWPNWKLACRKGALNAIHLLYLRHASTTSPVRNRSDLEVIPSTLVHFLHPWPYSSTCLHRGHSFVADLHAI